MYSARDNNRSSYGDLLRSGPKVGNNGHLTIISCDCLANYGLPYSILALRLAQVLQQLRAVRVSIWITMSHIDFVLVILKLHLESQCIVESTSLLLEGILEVADVLPISVPSDALAVVTIRHLFRVEKWLHALIIGTLWLHKIHKIKLICSELLCIRNFKVEPLGISSGVMIVLEYKIILVFAYFDCSA
jgi:hypothetical protein